MAAVEWSLKWWCTNKSSKKCIYHDGVQHAHPPALKHKNIVYAHYGEFLENVPVQKNYCIFQGYIYLCFMYKVYTWLSKNLHIPHSWKITLLLSKTFLTHFQQNDLDILTCVRATSYIRIIHEIFRTKLM